MYDGQTPQTTNIIRLGLRLPRADARAWPDLFVDGTHALRLVDRAHGGCGDPGAVDAGLKSVRIVRTSNRLEG